MKDKNEIVTKLLARKKSWEKKQDFYHVLYHRYERRKNYFYIFFLLFFLFTEFSSLTKNSWITLIFSCIFLTNLAIFIYFTCRWSKYSRKLENSLAKINQINEKLIEIMIPSQLANSTAQPS